MDGLKGEHAAREYVQDLLLREIYAEPDIGIVFKGGTALRKAYGLQRFSEDIDLDVSEDNLPVIDSALDRFGTRVASIVNDFESERLHTRTQTIYNLVVLHPKIGKPATVRIDASFESALLRPALQLLKSDEGSFGVYVMAKEEILAEKVRAIYDEKRNKPRDLYDLAFLLGIKTEANQMLIYEKLKPTGKRYSFKTFSGRIAVLSRDWDNDLGPLVEHLPSFTDIADTVYTAFRNLNF